MRAARSRLTAQLRSADQPTEEQLQRFDQFLTQTYKRKVPLHWELDESLQDGFRLQVGSDVYDWTLDGRVRQFQDYLRRLHTGQNDLLPLMRQAVEDWTVAVAPEEIGEVLTVDGEIATVGGLEHAQYGEILIFSDGIRGMVQDLDLEKLGADVAYTVDGGAEHYGDELMRVGLTVSDAAAGESEQRSGITGDFASHIFVVKSV